LGNVQQGIEAAGRELRSRNGSLETGSCFGGAKGRCEIPGSGRNERQAAFEALIRCSQKGRREAEELPPVSPAQKLRAVHAGAELGCESDHLEPNFFWGAVPPGSRVWLAPHRFYYLTDSNFKDQISVLLEGRQSIFEQVKPLVVPCVLAVQYCG
jgi:hypothetical protein